MRYNLYILYILFLLRVLLERERERPQKAKAMFNMQNSYFEIIRLHVI